MATTTDISGSLSNSVSALSRLTATTLLDGSGAQILTAQQPAIADSAVDLAELTTQFNTLLATLRTHGLIAT